MANAAPKIELKGEDDAVSIVTKSLGELQQTVETRLAAIEEKSAANDNRLTKFEARLNRPGAANENENAAEELEAKAFANYLRGGDKRLTAEEVKALVVADDGRGGYLATPELTTEVIKAITLVSPMRQAARVGSTSSGSIILPKRTGKPTAKWVGETEDRTGTGSTYGQLEIAVHEMGCYVDVSQRLLEDSAININAEVGYDLGEEFGRLEGEALLNGDGAKKPLGLMKAEGIAFIGTGNASSLGSAPADKLIDLVYSLKPAYRASGVWMLNGATLAVIRKLKDGQGNFLWQPSIQAGQPETILGRPVIEAADMPDIGAGAEPIIFGDIARAYRIFDRVSLNSFVDPFTQATNGLVRIHARRRVGGGLVLAEAVRKLKCVA